MPRVFRPRRSYVGPGDRRHVLYSRLRALSVLCCLFSLCVPAHGDADHLIVLVSRVDAPLESIVDRLSSVNVSNDAYKPKMTGRLLLDRPVGSAPDSDHSYNTEGKPPKRTLTGTAATARLLCLDGNIEALPRDRSAKLPCCIAAVYAVYKATHAQASSPGNCSACTALHKTVQD